MNFSRLKPISGVYLTLKPNFERTAVITKNESEPHLLFEEGGSRLDYTEDEWSAVVHACCTDGRFTNVGRHAVALAD